MRKGADPGPSKRDRSQVDHRPPLFLLYETKGRRAFDTQPLPQQWDRRMRLGDGARA